MDVSVIMCCYNSEKVLPVTLKHIARLSTDGITVELVLVNNNSSDNTTRVAKREWLKYKTSIEFTIVDQPTPGLMEARKRGIEKSKGEILIFCDDDNWLQWDYALLSYRIMRQNLEIGACGGKIRPVFESIKPEWFEGVKGSYAIGEQLPNTGIVPVQKGYLWGAGLVIRKKAWMSIIQSNFVFNLSGRKGKKLTAGEDSEICKVLLLNDWLLWYDQRLLLKHFLTSQRLTKEYLVELYRGFGRSSVVLRPYTDLLKRKSQNIKGFRYFLNWRTESMFLLKSLWKNKDCVVFRRSIIDQNRLNFELKYGRFLEVLKMRGKYDLLMKKLLSN